MVMNDYEVTPALLQLCGTASSAHGHDHGHKQSPRNSHRKTAESADPSGAGVDDRLKAGVGGYVEEEMQLDVTALFTLMSTLIESLEAAQVDRSRNVWSVVSQTAIFRTVRASSIPTSHLSRFYFMLHTLLALHSAAMLNTSLTEVKQKQAERVAYVVGQEVLTLADIRGRL